MEADIVAAEDKKFVQSVAKFERIRKAHQSEVAEDYVEMIAELISETGEARAVDLAARFGVTAPTVNATIQRLQKDGLVTARPYRSIFLTEAGQQLAYDCKARHEIVRNFLIAIGVDEETADEDLNNKDVFENSNVSIKRSYRNFKRQKL